MKKIKFIAIVLLLATCFVSCGSSYYSNMSSEEAYEVGYNIGSAIRYLAE